MPFTREGGYEQCWHCKLCVCSSQWIHACNDAITSTQDKFTRTYELLSLLKKSIHGRVFKKFSTKRYWCALLHYHAKCWRLTLSVALKRTEPPSKQSPKTFLFKPLYGSSFANVSCTYQIIHQLPRSRYNNAYMKDYAETLTCTNPLMMFKKFPKNREDAHKKNFKKNHRKPSKVIILIKSVELLVVNTEFSFRRN